MAHSPESDPYELRVHARLPSKLAHYAGKNLYPFIWPGKFVPIHLVPCREILHFATQQLANLEDNCLREMKTPIVDPAMCSSPWSKTRGIACSFQSFDERICEKKTEVEDGLLLKAGIIS
ncbi:uncharacterized protein Bfra_005464 [Botrytis fragariae]|uniref:Uncharacterized protein n=1 Tax=Botrytis fragariae TaxID=1964551 RepID=A0A8H6AUQ1_9HELO|nr:uncharacterized protein Bfra_005464 [Botrytis fragariae]KAF5873997.1 hypothetical protein Bfra_005464 [Botrytis fragariae]